MERRIPNNLFEKYSDERVQLYHLLWALEDAIMNLSSGNVSSYSLGNRSVTYTDLDKLKLTLKETEDRINELEAFLNGRSARNVMTSTFLDPALMLPRRP